MSFPSFMETSTTYLFRSNGGGIVEVGRGCLEGWFARLYTHKGVESLYDDEELRCQHDSEAISNPLPLTPRRTAAMIRLGYMMKEQR